ncbi:MAG: SUMF1/EgtB/PvdO family nonheme iron enzyme [Bacteroidales bacterium]|nr:SUMF1/EgtB/PvdO family nonheme iron enzyme [Bacteroidales bacterium]
MKYLVGAVAVAACVLSVGAQKRTAAKKAATVKTEVVEAVDNGLHPRWREDVTPAQKAVLQRLINNMVKVDGGIFKMGGTPDQGSDAHKDEKPVHEVTLTNYYIGRYEVTQAEWEAVMGENHSLEKNPKKAIGSLNYKKCLLFVRKLNLLTGLHFALPTEAQWEFAARGGNKSRGYKFSGSNNINEVGWCCTNVPQCEPMPVGLKKPNELGLYDMTGNVWEQCADVYAPYPSGPKTNPTGPEKGLDHVHRGGGVQMYARYCRVAMRRECGPSQEIYDMGLRLAHDEPW